ncbi:hypothetical protein AGOR_G00007320 [Albula goreensis]|uniref:Uncharacterized protein n=1 Tax=Albula goreensis TaxID=1534307 RepID=A0A8T3E669_9TELE|nr:hypothetical protein AGOR_G00007320 [Albula goreensis]
MTPVDISQKDWYAILDSSPSDSIQELKQKYQRLALLYHPDKQGPDVAAGEVEQHVQRFIEVDQAWKILSNEETRRAYDLQLRAHKLKQSWPVDAHICLDDMECDEDEHIYTYSCRCGGQFIIGKEDVEEEESVICCDTCSLSIEVKRSA